MPNRSAKGAKARCATVIGLINAQGSPVSEHAHLTLPIGAGPELAVPATKSVIGSIAAVGVVSYLLFLGFSESTDAVRQPMTTWVPKSDNAELVHGVYRLVFTLAAAVFVGIRSNTERA